MSLAEQVIDALSGLSVDVWHLPAPDPPGVSDPVVVFWRDDGQRKQRYQLDGTRELARSGVQFMVWSEAAEAVQATATQLEALLEAHSSATVRKVFIRSRSTKFDERTERHGLHIETEFVTTED